MWFSKVSIGQENIRIWSFGQDRKMREKLGLHMHRIADAMMCPPKFVHAIQRAKPWRNCIFLSPKGGRQKVVENVAWFIANLWTLWFASLLTFLGFQGNISIEISTPYGRLKSLIILMMFFFGTSPNEQWTEGIQQWIERICYVSNCRYSSNELNMIFVCILMIRERTMNCISEMLFLSNFHR